jgi:hypothetical protein
MDPSRLIGAAPKGCLQMPNAKDNPPWITALAEVGHRACREGWCYHHVQAIIVSIDQYAEAALGNREYFLNRPHAPPQRAHGLVGHGDAPVMSEGCQPLISGQDALRAIVLAVPPATAPYRASGLVP